MLLKINRILHVCPSDTIFFHSPLTLLLGYHLHLPLQVSPLLHFYYGARLSTYYAV